MKIDISQERPYALLKWINANEDLRKAYIEEEFWVYFEPLIDKYFSYSHEQLQHTMNDFNERRSNIK